MAEYIEREAIVKEIKEEIKACDVKFVEDIQIKKGLKIALKDIKVAKAADVQPIKHGRWIWVKDYRDCEGDIYSQYKCSCCDFCVGGVYSVKDLTHLCGNCGARTDGEPDEPWQSE